MKPPFHSHVILSLAFVLFSFFAKAQSISIDAANFNTTGYGKGSDITLPIKLNGCFGFGNKFELFISDNNGNFPPSPAKIGEFNGFFTPFVNGRIPFTLTSGSQYRIRINSTSPATSLVSGPIEVLGATALNNSTTSSEVLSQAIDTVFGKCTYPSSPYEILLQNNSPGAVFSYKLLDSLGNSVALSPVSANLVKFNAIRGNYYSFQSILENGGVKSIKSYLILATPSNLGIQGSGLNEICLPDTKFYTANNTGPESFKLNYPGTYYKIIWGDNTPVDSLTHCQFVQSNGVFSHFYQQSSCGQPPIATGNGTFQYNAFKVTISAKNGNLPCNFPPFTAYPKVYQKPVASFSAPPYACKDTTLTFFNSSFAGLSGPNDAVNCGSGQVKYKWYVNGVQVIGAPKDFVKTFNDTGTYQIRLVVENDPCVDEITRTICIEPRPVVNYLINGLDSLSLCGNDTIRTTNLSSVNNCRNNLWKWRVCYYSTGLDVSPLGGIYTILPSDTAFEPIFVFHVPGKYIIHLSVTNSCGTYFKDEPRIVDFVGAANVTLPSAKIYCGNNVQINFATNTNHRPVYNSNQGSEVYKWTVTGGGYSYSAPTDSTSRYPIILFNDFATYTVAVQFTSNCGSKTASQQISFVQGISIRAIEDSISRCGNVDTLQVAALVSGGIADSIRWKTTGSGSFNPFNNTSTIYTLSAADKAAGNFNLIVIGYGKSPCDSVTDTIRVRLYSSNTGRDSSLVICSGKAIAYSPVSGISNSTFSWVSQVTAGTVTGNTGSGSGPIADVLLNSGAVDGIVEYLITPNFNNCSGTPFRLKVTVKPKPQLSAQSAKDSICSGLSVNIQLSANVPGTLFSWSSTTVSGIVTGNTNQADQPVNAIADVLQNTGAGPGSVQYRIWGKANGNCPSDTLTLIITVVPGVSAANAGPDQNLCNLPQALLAANTPVVGTGSWQQLSGPVVNILASGQSNTLITLLSGGNTYSFQWKIESGNALCGSSSDVVVITNKPGIQGDSIRPLSQTICQGQSITITGSLPTGGNGNFAYNWYQGFSLASFTLINGQNGKDITVSPAVTTFYYREVISDGCKFIRDTVLVEVKDGIGNNSISGDQQICTGNSAAVLLGSVPSGGGGMPGYTWEFSLTGTGNWNLAPGAPLLKDYNPGNLTQTTFYRRSIRTNLCSNLPSLSNVVKITVRENAKAVFTASDTIDCAPFILNNVISTTPYPDRNSTYEWFANGQSIGVNTTGTFPGYTIPAAGQRAEIKLISRSAYGCKDDSMSVFFRTVQDVTAKFKKDTGWGCSGLRVNFTNESSVLDNSFDYTWDFGNGQIIKTLNPLPVDYPANPNYKDTVYYITLSVDNGCNTTYWRDSVRIRANPKSKFGADTTFSCSNHLFTFTNGSLGNPSVYYWDYGNGQADTVFSALPPRQIVYNTGFLDTFRIRLIAENECRRDTSYLNVVVAPNTIRPRININGSQLLGCVPHTVNIINSSTGASSFTWNFGDGSLPVQTSGAPSNIPYTYNFPGIFNITSNMSNGCSDTSASLQVQVFLRPVAAFTLNGTSFCAGDTVRITSNTSANANAYRWDWGDNTSSVGVSPVHTFTAAGNYTVTLYADRVVNQGVVCTDVFQRTISIADKPRMNLSSNLGAANCAPFTLNAIATALTSETAVWAIYDNTTQVQVATANGTQFQYLLNNPGTYVLKLLVRNTLGCADSLIRIFQVYHKPLAAFNPGNIFTCNTDTTVGYLNTTTYNGNDQVGYAWLVNGALATQNANLTYQYTSGPGVTLPQTFNTWLIAFNTKGCSDTARRTLTIQPRARAQFNLVNPNNCVPFYLQVNNQSVQATRYRWLLNNNQVSTAANPQIAITQASTNYLLTLIAENDFGCRPDTFHFNFTSRIKPKARFSLIDTLSCTGNLNAVTNNLTLDANSYSWNWGDGSQGSNLVSPTYFYTSPGEYLITLVASDGLCKDTTERRVRIAARLTPGLVATPTVGCDTTIVQFTNLTAPQGLGYLWDFGDGSVSTATNPAHTYLPRASPYTVTLTATGSYNCKYSVTQPALINAKQPPRADFYVLPRPVISIPEYSFQFVNTTPDNLNYRYKWLFGDGKSDTLRSITRHLYSDTGSYLVELIVFDRTTGCADTMRQLVRIIGQPGYLYVPNAMCMNCSNPALRSFLPIGKGLSEYKLQIYTTWGELVFETDKLDIQGRPSVAWDGSYKGKQLPQDVYVWIVTKAKFRSGGDWQGMVYGSGKISKNTGTITVLR